MARPPNAQPNSCDSVVTDDLRLALADRSKDAPIFEAFRCWGPGSTAPWAQEVEAFVQTRVLREAQHTLKWVVDGQLAAVAAFDVDQMEFPLLHPDHDEPVWYLRVVALTCAMQRAGRSQAVFSEVFRLMRLLDESRHLVYGVVHPDNSWSFKASATAGLDKLYRRDDGYWVVCGPIP